MRDIAQPMIDAVRRGEGPAILECATTRVHGHYEGDAQKYRDSGEIEALGERDPIRIAAEKLLASGKSDADLAAIALRSMPEIDAAVAFARGCPEPDFAKALADVYTETGR